MATPTPYTVEVTVSEVKQRNSKLSIRFSEIEQSFSTKKSSWLRLIYQRIFKIIALRKRYENCQVHDKLCSSMQ